MESNSRKLFLLTEHLIEVSKVMNLTAIKEEKAIILKHLADSLSVADFLPENAKMIDVGCGAGFPCLPLAICRPDLTITALDSTEKRVRYVSETAKLLEVSPKRFVDFLLEKKYIYRDQKGKLMPYAEKNNGLFELKERFNDKTQWTGTQTLITPKGRETFRLLMVM